MYPSWRFQFFILKRDFGVQHVQEQCRTKKVRAIDPFSLHFLYLENCCLTKILRYENVMKRKEAHPLNPSSSIIHEQILRTDLYTFPYRISWENFPLGGHFIYSHKRFFKLHIEIVRRKLLLVTLGTLKRVKNIMTFICKRKNERS